MDPTTSTKAAEETAKAVQEVAKITGQAIQAIRDVLSYLARLSGGPVEQAWGILEDRLRYTRWERRVRLLGRARAFAVAHGVPEPTRQVPLGLLVPLLEAGAAEEDDELQDAWARMLVNAADADHGAEVRRAYVSILADCTSLDVRTLAALHRALPDLGEDVVVSAFLPDRVVHLSEHQPDPCPPPAGDVQLSLSNLSRLGLVFGELLEGGDDRLRAVTITALGVGLVEACTLRDRNGPAQVEPAKSSG